MEFRLWWGEECGVCWQSERERNVVDIDYLENQCCCANLVCATCVREGDLTRCPFCRNPMDTGSTIDVEMFAVNGYTGQPTSTLRPRYIQKAKLYWRRAFENQNGYRRMRPYLYETRADGHWHLGDETHPVHQLLKTGSFSDYREAGACTTQLMANSYVMTQIRAFFNRKK